jgi:ABC-2 type transport system permease protein
VAVGHQPLVGLDGHLLTSADAAGKVLLAWVCVLAPTLALAAIGLLGSVALGRSPMGLLLPALVALALQLAQMLPLPAAVRLALPGYAFIAWNGLFTSPAQLGPLLIGIAVSLVWAVTATALAYLLFVRRDFTNLAYDGSGRRAVTAGVLPLAGLLAVTVAVVAAATGATGSGIEQDKVQRSVATAFAHLYRVQTGQLNRPDVTEAQLNAAATCNKGGGKLAAQGPGNDWRCVVSWHLPGVEAAGSAIYQLDITADGRFVADGDGPKEVNGYFLVRTPDGDAPNPLWQFDGNVDLLPTAPKG